MLGLFSRKSDHPLADIKSAQALLADLPKNDALKSLQELTAWLESVREHADFRLDYRLEILRLLDDTARPFERKLNRDYFSVGVLSVFQENRLWIALNDFFSQAWLAYRDVFHRYCNGEKGASSIQSLLPFIAVRAISTVSGKLKSAAARHALVEQTIWESLAACYSHAEKHKYVDETVSVSSGSSIKTTVRGEFATLLLWYASSFGTLSRLHMQVAERLATSLKMSFSVTAQPEPGSRYTFDLLHPMSPMRLGLDNQQQPGLRFLGIGEFQSKSEALLKSLEKNIVPEELNLGGHFDAGVLRTVLLHLGECLSSPPPTRRNARHRIEAELSVAKGLSEVMRIIRSDSYSETLWNVEDISTSGLCCTVPAQGMSNIEIGSLIGIKPEKKENWGVGIVRRIMRNPENILRVGIEMLSNQVEEVSVREQGGGTSGRQVLWLGSPGGAQDEVTLLMDADTYSSSRSIHATLNDRNYLLIPLRRVENGEDYDLGRYRKIVEDTRPDN